MKINKLIVTCIYLFSFILIASSESSEAEKQVYLKRYCEVLELQVNGLFGIFSEVSLNVWNTMGYNDCPQESWEALSLPMNVFRNGPRYWLMDRIKVRGKTKEYVENAEVRDWGNLEMNKVATVSFPTFFSFLSRLANRHYAVNEVDRDTIFIWNANSKVHTLFNGTHSWVMQSYLATDPSATLERLSSLSSLYHNLPPHLSYETCYLTEELQVGAEGKAYVMQDELLNTFQLYSTPSHLCSFSHSTRVKSHDEL